MVKFIVTKEGFSPNNIEFLKDRFDIAYTSNDGTTIFETENKLTSRLIVFEEGGFLKIIREKRDLGVINNFDLLENVIEKVEKKAGDPVFFYIYIGNDRIRFTSLEFITLRKWREKLIEIDIQIASRVSSKEFDKFISMVRSRIEVVWVDEESEEDMTASIVMEGINQLIWVDNEKDFLRNPVCKLMLDSDDIDIFRDDNGHDAFIVKSSTMKNILDQRRIDISLVRAREVIRPYLYRNSKQKRIAGERPSVWFFKK